ncbi:hypothetical protein BY996DRAFT_6506923 [Phakopsora pachyrhizi]|nr:hypothetical protein BY996DRAFT_6506923 [Phakopsora pachyrhizi]
MVGRAAFIVIKTEVEVGYRRVMRDLLTLLDNRRNLNLEDLFLPKCSLNILRKVIHKFNQEYASLAQMSGLLRGKRTWDCIQTKGIRDESMKKCYIKTIFCALNNSIPCTDGQYTLTQLFDKLECGVQTFCKSSRIFVVKRVKYAPSTRQESRILERCDLLSSYIMSGIRRTTASTRKLDCLASKQDDKRDSLGFDHRLRYAVVRKVVERFEGDTTPLSQAFWKLCGMDFILIGGYGEMNHRFFCNQLAFDSQLYRALTLQTAEWWQTKLTDVWSKKMGT